MSADSANAPTDSLRAFAYWGVVYRPKDTDHAFADWGDWTNEIVARHEAERCRAELPEMEVKLRKVVKVVEYLDA